MIAKDITAAARTLRNHPGFALTAMVTIGLGIGASTAIFSVFNAVLLHRLPYTDPDRLVLIWTDLKARNVLDFPFSQGDFHVLKTTAATFEGFAAIATGRTTVSGPEGDPEQIRTCATTPNLFRLLGARVALGRDFTDQDGVPQPQPAQQSGAASQQAPARLPNTAILSHQFWQRRYGGDRAILGRVIEVGNGRAEVAGVLAQDFELLFPPNANIERIPDVYTAMRVNFELGSHINHGLRVIGRLKPGVAPKRAQDELDQIAAGLRERFPIKNTAGMVYRLESMHEDLVADVRQAIVALMGAVSFLLLIACANVANLLLVRASLRERELAVRAALGGSRWRLVRQMLAESLLLSAGGLVIGLLLAWRGIELLLLLKPANLPRITSVSIDPLVLAFAAIAALASAAIFGVVPALRASRPDVMEALRSSGRTAGLGRGRLLRSAVVMMEVALSFVLLIGSGLMVRSFIELQRARPGYDPNGLLTFQISGLRGQSEQRQVFVRQLRDRLAALPGVQSVTAVNPLPLDGQNTAWPWGTEAAAADPSKFQQAGGHIVLPGYFETMRTPLLAGRTFTEADNVPGQRILIVDQRLAQKAFPGENAVGKRLLMRFGGDQREYFEIIGVVGHQRQTSLAADGREGVFVTDGLLGPGAVNRWVIRTSGDPSALAGAARAEVRALDPRVTVTEMQPMSAFVDRATAPTRFALALIGVFALIAAALAAIGLYGVLSNVVRQRTAEIGVRMALGAAPAGILRLVVAHGLKLSAAGIAIGLIAAFWLTSAMRTMLVGVEPTDPATFGAVAALFLAISILACWLPARRAAGLDPTVALREE